MEMNLDEIISKNLKEEIEQSGKTKTEIAKAIRRHFCFNEYSFPDKISRIGIVKHLKSLQLSISVTRYFEASSESFGAVTEKISV